MRVQEYFDGKIISFIEDYENTIGYVIPSKATSKLKLNYDGVLSFSIDVRSKTGVFSRSRLPFHTSVEVLLDLFKNKVIKFVDRDSFKGVGNEI